MACPICGANCVCKHRGQGGLCCGCHRHRSQKGFTRVQLDTWRAQHQLPPVSDVDWTKRYARHVAQPAAQPEAAR